MSAGRTGIEQQHNTARFFAEHRSVAFVLLAIVIAWGTFAWESMPRLKDPVIPVRVASAVTAWPGANAETVDRQLTRLIEQTISESAEIHPPQPGKYGIQSLSMPGVSIIQIQLDEAADDPQREFDAINLKLNALNDKLPDGAGPIQFNAGFGDTAALLLTVASPKEGDIELEVRARDIAAALEADRATLPAGEREGRVAIVVALPRSVDLAAVRPVLAYFARTLTERSDAGVVRQIVGPGFVGIDSGLHQNDEDLRAMLRRFVSANLGDLRFHPDAWQAALIRDPADTLEALKQVRGDKYSYAELDDFIDLISRTLETVPLVSKIESSGDVDQRVWLEYSQERLASYGLSPDQLANVLSARNTAIPGGLMDVGDGRVLIEPTGQFNSAAEIGNVIATTDSDGSPVYLRDVLTVRDGYESPPRLLNFYGYEAQDGTWQRSRAISLAIQMRDNKQIGVFGDMVDATLAELGMILPNDLIFARVSDQPEQVADNLDLFSRALIEAIVLVVLIALVGFWEWRSALLMMLAIPITLTLTFGMIDVLGIQLQQVSIATLIIALGLLVDDPVVANDAIKRELGAGKARVLAAWLGPTKLAKAIMFATVTNIVAYLPFLLLTGDQGDFLYSLPVVMACALLASRLVSMTFIPLLGYYILRPRRLAERTIEELRSSGFTGGYYRVGRFAIAHRKKVLLASFLILAGGVVVAHHLKTSFFPDDVQRLFYIDVWMDNGDNLNATSAAAQAAEQVVRDVVGQYARDTAGDDGAPREVLQSLATFVGGGAPRFWFSVTPQQQDPSYAQILVNLVDKEDMPPLIPMLQQALSESVPGAFIDVRQLQTNPVNYPVAVRLYGRATIATEHEDRAIATLMALAREATEILRSTPLSARGRDDWGGEVFRVRLDIDNDRANLAGITNADIASSSSGGISGQQVGTMRVSDKQIPIYARMALSERANLGDLQNLYVYGSGSASKVPLLQVADLDYGLELQRMRRLDHFPTITVYAFPVQGALASDVFNAVHDRLAAFAAQLPPGYQMAIDGEQARQSDGFGQLGKVLMISIAGIYLALVLQFGSAVKPLLVFMAVPYGVVGALTGLLVMQSSFGYMAFLGIIALIGVIVSHVIVLFDFIEEKREEGESLHEALLDAGIIRLRPVLITVGATVLALFPLAMEGGPLWQPLCYAQIGGLVIATVVTLLLVPVFYAIFVLDLKIVRWETPQPAA